MPLHGKTGIPPSSSSSHLDPNDPETSGENGSNMDPTTPCFFWGGVIGYGYIYMLFVFFFKYALFEK